MGTCWGVHASIRLRQMSSLVQRGHFHNKIIFSLYVCPFMCVASLFCYHTNHPLTPLYVYVRYAFSSTNKPQHQNQDQNRGRDIANAVGGGNRGGNTQLVPDMDGDVVRESERERERSTGQKQNQQKSRIEKEKKQERERQRQRQEDTVQVEVEVEVQQMPSGLGLGSLSGGERDISAVRVGGVAMQEVQAFDVFGDGEESGDGSGSVGGGSSRSGSRVGEGNDGEGEDREEDSGASGSDESEVEDEEALKQYLNL